MRSQAGVVHALDRWMRGEEVRHRARVRAMHGHACAQRAAAAQDQPSAERRQRRAGDVQPVRDLLRQRIVLREHQRAAEHVAVAAEILGGRMHHHVRAQRQRALQQRRGEGVVGDDHGTRRVTDFRQRGDVADLHLRVRRCLDPQQVDTLRAGVADRIKVGHVDQLRRDAAFRQVFGADHAQAGVAVVRDQHARAVGQAFEQDADRRHARSESAGRFAAFQRRQRLAQAVVGRVALALVLVAGHALAGRAVAEGGGEVDRRRDRAGGGIRFVADVDGHGFGAKLRTHATGSPAGDVRPAPIADRRCVGNGDPTCPRAPRRRRSRVCRR